MIYRWCKNHVVKTFARDVAVNVLANLIAAAVIYLLGVLAGLFPRTTQAVNLSIGVITIASFAVLVVAAISRLRLNPRQSTYRKSLYISAIAGILCGITMASGSLLFPNLPTFDRITGTLFGISLAFFMAVVIAALVRQGGHRDAAAVRHGQEDRPD